MYSLNNRKIISMLDNFANFVSILGLQSCDYLFCSCVVNQRIIFLCEAKIPLKRGEIAKKNSRFSNKIDTKFVLLG